MRIAYIGLTYPTFYDYLHLADRTSNDMSSSPNPILESPWGLMTLYDELWFLCESLCPNNMRKLSYVKFVDKLLPDLFLKDVDNNIFDVQEYGYYGDISYNNIMDKMNLDYTIRKGLDVHTHELRIGSLFVNAKDDLYNYYIDMQVMDILKKKTKENICLISNSFHKYNVTRYGGELSVADNIVIANIDNYIWPNGPYHPCVEKLREHPYLRDFRKWIQENHSNLQKMEVNEMREYVNSTIREVQENYFMEYLEENNNKNFYKSCSKTILNTGLGIPFAAISIISAGKEIVSKYNEKKNSDKYRWMGFVTDAQKIVVDINNES